jgi:hypothetical protein
LREQLLFTLVQSSHRHSASELVAAVVREHYYYYYPVISLFDAFQFHRLGLAIIAGILMSIVGLVWDGGPFKIEVPFSSAAPRPAQRSV